MVAKLDGSRRHETVDRAIVALENLEHRGAAGADPNTGDGAGILLQLPDEFIRGVIDEDLPPPGAYGVCVCFLPARATSRREELEQLLETTVARRGPARRRLARRAGRQGLRRHHGQPLRALRQAARRGGVRRARGRPGRVRAQALRDPPRGRDRRRPGARDPELQQPHDRLQGHAHQPAAAGLLPGPAGPAHEVRARARPLALLHQHVPELGARAPVPDDRPQRRDQHAARQHQLDARARVAARVRAVRRRPAEGPADRPPRRQRLARRSTTCSSCSCWPAAASRTR